MALARNYAVEAGPQCRSPRCFCSLLAACAQRPGCGAGAANDDWLRRGIVRLRTVSLLAAISLSLSACAGVGGEGLGYGGYSLIRVNEVRVGDDSLAVTPPRQWNKVSARVFTDIRDVEDW